jgi:Phosphate-selective porin O and P
MSLTKNVGILSGVAVLTLTGVGHAATQAGTQDARIAELEAQVAELRASQGDNWLTEQRAGEIRGLVQDVLADADTRASLQGSGMTAGWDKGFFLASADGNFKLKLSGQVQVRWAWRYDDASGNDTHRHGFENSRTKLFFDGNVVDPSWTYRVNGRFSRSTGTFALEDAWIKKSFDGGWYVRGGQYKLPFNREELVSSSKQLFVERSVINEAFNLDRGQGIEAGWEGDNIRFALAYSDGENTPNTAAALRDTEFAFTGRIEGMIAGNWKQFDDFTSWRGEDFGLMLGGAIHYEKDEYGTVADINENETFNWTIDGSAEFGGGNLFVAFIGRHDDDDAGAEFDRYGLIGQGGLFVTDDFELMARFEWGDDDSIGSEDLMLLTLGFNWYWSKHQLKWTTDGGWAFDGVSNFFGTGNQDSTTVNTGWEPQGQDDDQLVIRTQVQLLF